jgi:hypothetical protein
MVVVEHILVDLDSFRMDQHIQAHLDLLDMGLVDILVDLDSFRMDLVEYILEHLGLLDMDRQVLLTHIQLRLDLQHMDQLVLDLVVEIHQLVVLPVLLVLFVLLVLLDLALLTHHLWSHHLVGMR